MPNPPYRATISSRTIASLVVKVAALNGMVVAGAVLLGRFLDAQFQTRVTFTVILAVVSLQLALFITYKLGMRTATQMDDTDARAKAEAVTNVTSKESELAAGEKASNRP